ncbi:MAG: hypothetical protein WC455_30670 [Dehalococcoidia bacterium]|jgi:hypothetical protein
MWGQHPEYARDKMIESYDIEAREREAKEKKSRESIEGVPDTPQKVPDFAPGQGKDPPNGEDME